MAARREDLVDGEQLVLTATFHWIVFAAGWFFAGLGLIGGLAWLATREAGGVAAALAALMFWLGLGLGLWLLVAAALQHSARSLVVTNRRVIGRKGVFQIKRINTFLEVVDSVAVHQTFLGQILDFGMVEIHWGGHSHPRRFWNVAKPKAVQDVILRGRASGGHASEAH